MFRPAAPEDLRQVQRLLSAAGLPLAGLDQTSLFVADDESGQVIGVIGYERHGSVGLLRSLVVDPARRGAGLGAFLLESGLQEMRRAGLREAYGLTETIAPWLDHLGWTARARADLPAALQASKELQGACAESAKAFSRPL